MRLRRIDLFSLISCSLSRWEELLGRGIGHLSVLWGSTETVYNWIFPELTEDETSTIREGVSGIPLLLVNLNHCRTNLHAKRYGFFSSPRVPLHSLDFVNRR